MSRPEENDLPLPQPGMGSRPPRPPKITARELGDDDGDWEKRLSESECDELRTWLEEYLDQSR